MSFVDNPRHSNRPPVIPATAGIQRGEAAGHPTNHKNHTNHSSDAPSRPSWTIPVIPAAAGIQGRGRGESHFAFRQLPSRPLVSWTIPVIPTAPHRHSGGGRNPEGRGGGTSQKSQKSQFRQPPSRPFVSFVDNPRHSNRPPVIPAAAGIQRGGDVGNPTNHKNHTNHSSDNSLRAPSRPSWTIPVIPTAHPSFRRRPESRGAGTWGIPLITKITRITVQTTPFAPLVSFVDNPRHSNRPPVIPAAAGIQRGGDVGNPTNHKNHKNHSSDNSLRAPSCPSWTIPVIPTAHPSFRRRPESRGAGTWGIPPITKITRITVQTTPFAPLVSFVDNPRHSDRPTPSFRRLPRTPIRGRNPEGRGRGESHQSQKSQFRQPPSRPLVSFVDNPRHSNRPPVIPAAAGIQRRGRGESHQSQKSHESQFRQPPSRPFAPFVDNPRHSNRPPVIPAAAGIQRRGRGESH